MAQILCIPDVHLKPGIFNRAEEILESGQADFAIQLGDLVDDWGEEFNYLLYDRTLERALEFHQKFPETLWCVGNHDFGYDFPEYGRRETGHSQTAELFVQEKFDELARAGMKASVIHVVDNVIFSHAGLTKKYVESITPDGMDCEMSDYIKTLVKQSAPDSLWGPYSPIWARPQISHDPLFSDKMQVVGHTPVEKITLSRAGKLLSTDVFSTHSNGAPIGERRLAIVDTEKMTWRYAEDTDTPTSI